MIKIIDDWYVTVETNPTNYVVRRGEGEKDKKNGWKDKPYAFFGSLREAVKFIRGQNYHGKTFNGLHPTFRRNSDHLRGGRPIRETHGKDWSVTTQKEE